MNKFNGPVGIGLALCLGTTLLAQEPPTRNTGTQSPSTSTTREAGRNTEGDQILVTWLLVDHENEVELSRLATSRAHAPEVKQFAQKMIDDHTQFVQKLQQHAGRAGGTVGAADRTGDPSRAADRAGTGQAGREGEPGRGTTGQGNTGRDPGTTGQGNTGRDPGTTGQGNTGRDPKGEFPPRSGQPADASATRAAMGGSFDHERLIRDLGRKCLESSTKMLNEKQGAEFDRCYMQMALAAHVKGVDTLEVFRNHASPALRPTLDEGLRTVQMHLQHAKDLAKRTDQMMPGAGK